MTRKTFKAMRDCAFKIKDMKVKEEQIKEMFSFLSMVDRLSEICEWEGPSGIRLEADGLPENTAYEKAFKESILLWMNGHSADEASDYAAYRYFEEDPSGYNAAIFFAAVFSVGKMLTGDLFGFIDMALQYLLPDGWRWWEEDEKEAEAHKDDKEWHQFMHSHRKEFLGDPKEEIRHRFDDSKVSSLVSKKDEIAEKAGKRIAERLTGFKDGALQLILKELTYTELERSLYALPEDVEDRIISNIAPYYIPVIKGQCLLNKNAVSSAEIRAAVKKLEEAINAYDGDPALEAEYED